MFFPFVFTILFAPNVSADPASLETSNPDDDSVRYNLPTNIEISNRVASEALLNPFEQGQIATVNRAVKICVFEIQHPNIPMPKPVKAVD